MADPVPSSNLSDGPTPGTLSGWLTPKPDPWPQEIDANVQQATAVPLCMHCLFPQGPHTWMCPQCGFPTGECVAWMPYLQNFVIGEAARQGVMGPPERRVAVNLFLVLMSLAQYSIFAPIYWFWMWRRSIGKPITEEQHFELVIED